MSSTKGKPKAGDEKPKTAKAGRLSPRESLFIDEYLTDLNVERAARAAGYSPSLAKTKAYMWVSDRKTKPHVFDEIQRRKEKTAAKLEITRERVMAEYARLAFSDPRKFFNDDGTLKHPTELDDDTGAALAQFEMLEEFAGSGQDKVQIGWTKKIKWSDKRGALDSLVKMMGWSEETLKLKTDPNDPLVELLRQVMGKSLPVVPMPTDDDED